MKLGGSGSCSLGASFRAGRASALPRDDDIQQNASINRLEAIPPETKTQTCVQTKLAQDSWIRTLHLQHVTRPFCTSGMKAIVNRTPCSGPRRVGVALCFL
jgi:hypothetical protein